MQYQRMIKMLSFVSLVGLLMACSDDSDDNGAMGADDNNEVGTIVQVAGDAGDFGTLLTALEAADLAETLGGEGPFTVFAPNDAAFAALPEGALDALLADTDSLSDVLLFHVVGENLTAAELSGRSSVTTLQGNEVSIEVMGDSVYVNGALVILADVAASNGTIHAIDSVLLPPAEAMTIPQVAASVGDFGTLLAAVDAAGLTETLSGEGPFTVFAPTDSAFAALPEGTVEALLEDIPTLTDILLYHVVGEELSAEEVVSMSMIETLQGEMVEVFVSGSEVYINDALVELTDVEASNGVIHVIDAVLMPPAEPNIVEVASEAGSFSTLIAALEAADLVDTLSGEGPFTVFAPTDAAFAALPEGTVDALLDDIPALTDILLYHVVSGELLASDVTGRSLIETLQGSSFRVTVNDDGAFINGALIETPDIGASNGVIHVIDAVITPPGTIADIATATPELSTLVAALVAADLVETLSGEGPFTVFAPTDEAFGDLPEGTLDALLGDIPTLTDILLYHVVADELPASEVVALTSVETVEGSSANISVMGGDAMIDGAKIIVTDIPASNGIIHLIDAVILPE